MRRGAAALGAVLLPAEPALAAGGVDPAALSLAWGLPFAGLLLSIALLPLVAGHLWHLHYGKIATAWSAALVLPFAWAFGAGAALAELRHVMLQDWLPFMALLLALFTTGGGVVLRGRLIGTPAVNTALLTAGTLAASVMGTTGASIVFLPPLLRANAFRARKVHSLVFFIFLVSNVGGVLTPLGDPPLYLGFLKGVGFFWTVWHLAGVFLFSAGLLLGLYWLLDRRQWAAEQPVVPQLREGEAGLHIRGRRNLLLLGAVLGVVLLQGVWQPGPVRVFGEAIGLERMVAVAAFLLITLVSFRLTPIALREENGFGWGAIVEVAKLFAAIFTCMAPLLAILRAGRDGAAAGLVGLTTDAGGAPVPVAYFWLTGLLSSFLDNAPTYLVFFNLAGGDPVRLMGPDAAVLAAISCGAVFMGANSYIGNAPNFMVKALAERAGVRMPGFFGYCAWAAVVLWPLFALITLVFFV